MVFYMSIIPKTCVFYYVITLLLWKMAVMSVLEISIKDSFLMVQWPCWRKSLQHVVVCWIQIVHGNVTYSNFFINTENILVTKEVSFLVSSVSRNRQCFKWWMLRSKCIRHNHWWNKIFMQMEFRKTVLVLANLTHLRTITLLIMMKSERPQVWKCFMYLLIKSSKKFKLSCKW